MSSRRDGWIAALVAGLCTVYTVGAMAIYPSLFPDPAYGLLVEQGRAAGAPWNHYLEPNPEDISQDLVHFNAAWSPGQQLLPSWLTRAGFTLGAAVRSVSLVASLAGLMGWFLLHRAMGIERRVALVAALLIASARSYSFPFLAYIGGDLLAFAAFPFLALLILRVRRSDWIVLVAPAAVLAAFFFKHSLALYVTGWIAAVVAVDFREAPRPLGRRVAVTGSAAILVAGALKLIEWGYASRGWSAIVYEPSWSTDPATYALPWALPMLAGTGVDYLLSRVFDNPQFTRIDFRHSFWMIIPVVTATVLVLTAAFRDRAVRAFSQTATLFIAAVVTVFMLLMASGSVNELYLARHYVILGAVLLPLLIHVLWRSPWAVVRAGGMLVLALPALYGVASFAANWARHYEARAAIADDVGIVHLAATPRVVDYMRQLNATLGRTTLVVVPEPSLAVEFDQTRVLATSATSASVHDFQRLKWRGRTSDLVVISEDGGQTPEEIHAWLASFVSYDPDGWDRFTVEGFSFHVPRGQSIDQARLQQALEGVAAER